MSIAAMVDNEVAKSKGEPPRTATRRRRPGAEHATAAKGAAAKGAAGPGEAVSALVSYVPAEAIAAYLLLLPFMDPSGTSYSGRWGLVVGVAVLAVVYAVGYRALAARQEGSRNEFPLIAVAVTIASFIAWVFAIPDSPFNDFDFYSPELGGAVGVVAAGLISFIGAVTGESLTYAATEEQGSDAEKGPGSGGTSGDVRRDPDRGRGSQRS